MARLDQDEINGREVLALAKRGEFEELKDRVIRCSCRPYGPVLARFFMGPEEGTGELKGWVWAAACDLGWTKTRPTATSIPLHAGEPAVTLHAQCGRCRSEWMIFPGGLPASMEQLPEQGVGAYVVVTFRPDKSHREPLAVGDRTTAAQITADRIQGPGPVLLVRVNRPTWGTIVP